MPDLTLGLAPGKNGFYDPKTNFYLSKDKPVNTLTYTEFSSLEGITHAILASVPALTLYAGELPQEAIDAWKGKFDKIFRAPTTRNIVENGKVIGQAPINYVLDSSIQSQGRPIEGNRAFDRTDDLEAGGVVGFEAPENEGEEVQSFSAAAVEEGDSKPEAPEAPPEEEVVTVSEEKKEAPEAPVEDPEAPEVPEEVKVEEAPADKKKVTRSTKKAK